MNPKNFFAELKRRNVYKVAIAYGVVAWLLMQVASQIFPFFEIPNWAVRLVVLLLVIGFPVALILAWAFELTPEGIKRTEAALPTGKPRIAAGIAALLAASTVNCSVAASGTPDAAGDLGFYVGSTGWHTSIVVPRAQIPTGTWPRGVTERTFSSYPYLEIGWGDRKFYTAPKPNVAMALHAAFLPGPSVLHVVGLKLPLERALPWSALVRVPCTRTEFASLCRALGDTFQRDASGRARALGPGLYGETSRFYQALGRYYLLNTCDTWTARMMRAGGLPANTSPAGTWSAGATLAQARRLAAQKLAAQRCDRVFDRVQVSIPQESAVRSARSKNFSRRYSEAESRQPLQ